MAGSSTNAIIINDDDGDGDGDLQFIASGELNMIQNSWPH
jgi:hypothetical protein